MCWRPWAINMRQHLWNLPLNSHVGCDRTTGAPSQASNDTVTCIPRPLLQCGGSPLVPPPLRLWCCAAWLPKLSAVRSCDSWFFFSLLLRSWKAGAERRRGPSSPSYSPGGGCSVVVPFPAHDCLFLARCGSFSSDMAGAIIENMSTKKLVIVGVTLLLFQAFAFMVGGLIGKFLLFLFYY